MAGVLVEVLSRKGFQAEVASGPTEDIFRVIVGPTKDAAELARIKADLEAAGFTSFTRRAPKLLANQRNKPDPVPATLLGQLAVHKDHQGQGHARSLLLFALKTAARASREIGSFGVVTHPIDDSVRAFYRRWRFVDLPFDPQGAMIVRIIDLEKAGIVP